MPAGVEITTPVPAGAEGVLTEDALAFVAGAAPRVQPDPGAPAGPPPGTPGRDRGGRPPVIPGRNRGGARRRLVGRPDARRAARPPGRDHRSDRPQDDDQRPQLRRQGLHGRPRGRLSPTWDNVIEGQLNLLRRRPPHDLLRQPGRPQLRAQRRRPRPCSCARAAGTCPSGTSPVDGEPISASLFDFGLYLLPQRPGADRPRRRPLLLPAEAGEPPRSPALERRLQLRPGRARHPARHDPRDGADRDDPRRLRDGGDPLRAARPRRRPQRRPLGLHLQR